MKVPDYCLLLQVGCSVISVSRCALQLTSHRRRSPVPHSNSESKMRRDKCISQRSSIGCVFPSRISIGWKFSLNLPENKQIEKSIELFRRPRVPALSPEAHHQASKAKAPPTVKDKTLQRPRTTKHPRNRRGELGFAVLAGAKSAQLWYALPPTAARWTVWVCGRLPHAETEEMGMVLL